MVRRYFFNDYFSESSWHIVSTVPYVQCMVGFSYDCGRLHISRTDAIISMVLFWQSARDSVSCCGWQYRAVSCYSIDLANKSRQPVNIILPSEIAEIIRRRASECGMKVYEIISSFYLEFHYFVSSHSESEVMLLIEGAQSYVSSLG